MVSEQMNVDIVTDLIRALMTNSALRFSIADGLVAALK